MGTKIGLTFDCADPDTLARFWMLALRYVEKPPPPDFATWSDYYRSIGVPEDELEDGLDLIMDPDDIGPRVWFQKVPEGKTAKNRLHIDLNISGGRAVGPEVRKNQVDSEVSRLVDAGASILRVLDDPTVDHYAVVLADPEGNEFCVN